LCALLYKNPYYVINLCALGQPISSALDDNTPTPYEMVRQQFLLPSSNVYTNTNWSQTKDKDNNELESKHAVILYSMIRFLGLRDLSSRHIKLRIDCPEQRHGTRILDCGETHW